MSSSLEFASGVIMINILILAQQEAQRATFIVEKAIQERQEKVVRAEGEAEAARMISLPSC